MPAILKRKHLRLCVLTLSLAIFASLAFEPLSIVNAQDHSYRSFTRTLSPEQLNRFLGSSDAIQQKIVSDKVADMVMEKFSNLSAEQKSNLLELAKEFSDGKANYNFENFSDKANQFENAIKNDPQLRQAAKELRDSFRQQNLNLPPSQRPQIDQELQRQIQQRIQREIEQRANSNNPFDNSFPNQNIDPNRPSTPNPINKSTNPFGNPNTSQRPNNPNSFQNNSRPNVGPRSSDPNRPTNSPNMDPTKRKSFDPSNNPFGGFSDDGKNSPNVNPSNSQNPRTPASASSSRQSTPKDSVGHRFNRLLMNSVEKAMEKKVEAGTSGNSPQSFERLMGKLLDSVSKSNAGTNVRQTGNSFFGKAGQTVQRAANRTRMNFKPFSNWGGSSSMPSMGSGGLSMPAISPRGLLVFLLVVGGIIALISFAVKKTPIGQMLGLQPIPPKKPAPPELPQTINDPTEIVTLVDRFTLWLFGKKADWWNSKKVQQQFMETKPEFANDVNSVMDIYDRARYSETNEPVSAQTVQEIRSTLNRLKESKSAEKSVASPDNPSPYLT